MGTFDEKTGGGKSRAIVPLISPCQDDNTCLVSRRAIYLCLSFFMIGNHRLLVSGGITVELTYPNPSLHLINFFGREGNINLT